MGQSSARMPSQLYIGATADVGWQTLPLSRNRLILQPAAFFQCGSGTLYLQQQSRCSQWVPIQMPAGRVLQRGASKASRGARNESISDFTSGFYSGEGIGVCEGNYD